MRLWLATRLRRAAAKLDPPPLRGTWDGPPCVVCEREFWREVGHDGNACAWCTPGRVLPAGFR